MSDSISMYSAQKVNGGTVWILFLVFGWSYGSLGSMGKQIFFYLTAGGLGLWLFYVLFTLNSKIKKRNKEIASRCGVSTDDMVKLGLL